MSRCRDCNYRGISVIRPQSIRPNKQIKLWASIQTNFSWGTTTTTKKSKKIKLKQPRESWAKHVALVYLYIIKIERKWIQINASIYRERNRTHLSRRRRKNKGAGKLTEVDGSCDGRRRVISRGRVANAPGDWETRQNKKERPRRRIEEGKTTDGWTDGRTEKKEKKKERKKERRRTGEGKRRVGCETTGAI